MVVFAATPIGTIDALNWSRMHQVCLLDASRQGQRQRCFQAIRAAADREEVTTVSEVQHAANQQALLGTVISVAGGFIASTGQDTDVGFGVAVIAVGEFLVLKGLVTGAALPRLWAAHDADLTAHSKRAARWRQRPPTVP